MQVANKPKTYAEYLAAYEAAQKALQTPPKCPRSMTEYIHEDGLLNLTCHLDYEAGQTETDIDPALDAQMHLCAAYVGSIDVSSALTKEQRQSIELAALGEYA